MRETKAPLSRGFRSSGLQGSATLGPSSRLINNRSKLRRARTRCDQRAVAVGAEAIFEHALERCGLAFGAANAAVGLVLGAGLRAIAQQLRVRLPGRH